MPGWTRLRGIAQRAEPPAIGYATVSSTFIVRGSSPCPARSWGSGSRGWAGPLRPKAAPTVARIGNPDSQHDPDDDLYIGEEWVRTVRYDDSYPAALLGWLELERATRGRRLLGFRPKHGRLDIIPRHVVTADIGGHDFERGARFGIVRALYAVEDVGGLPRLRSEFVLAAMKE